jgi:hypothetical protein
VGAFEAGDGADGLAGVGVDHFHVGSVRNVEAMRGGVGEQIVPAAFAADDPFVHHREWLLGVD